MATHGYVGSVEDIRRISSPSLPPFCRGPSALTLPVPTAPRHGLSLNRRRQEKEREDKKKKFEEQKQQHVRGSRAQHCP